MYPCHQASNSVSLMTKYLRRLEAKLFIVSMLSREKQNNIYITMKKYFFILMAAFCTTVFSSCMRDVTRQSQFDALQGTTYMYAAIVAVIIFLMAFLISIMIPWKVEGGKDRSYIKRRVALVICIALGSIGFWIYNRFYVKKHITSSFTDQFDTTNTLSFLITILGSIVISLIVMVCFKNSKFASIIFKIKGK